MHFLGKFILFAECAKQIWIAGNVAVVVVPPLLPFHFTSAGPLLQTNGDELPHCTLFDIDDNSKTVYISVWAPFFPSVLLKAQNRGLCLSPIFQRILRQGFVRIFSNLLSRMCLFRIFAYVGESVVFFFSLRTVFWGNDGQYFEENWMVPYSRQYIEIYDVR